MIIRSILNDNIAAAVSFPYRGWEISCSRIPRLPSLDVITPQGDIDSNFMTREPTIESIMEAKAYIDAQFGE